MFKRSKQETAPSLPGPTTVAGRRLLGQVPEGDRAAVLATAGQLVAERGYSQAASLEIAVTRYQRTNG